MDGTLFVHREFNGSYQLVGILEENAGFPIFTYSPKYLESGDAAPISISLPLTAETFGPDATGSFFSGIIPEGQLNRDLEKRARAERGDYFKVLDLVRDEPVGALVLTREPSGDSLEMDYEEIGAEQLSGLAYAPAGRPPATTALEPNEPARAAWSRLFARQFSITINSTPYTMSASATTGAL